MKKLIMICVVALSALIAPVNAQTLNEALIMEYKGVHEGCVVYVNENFEEIKKAALMELGVIAPDEVIAAFGYHVCISQTYNYIVEENVKTMQENYGGDKL